MAACTECCNNLFICYYCIILCLHCIDFCSSVQYIWEGHMKFISALLFDIRALTSLSTSLFLSLCGFLSAIQSRKNILISINAFLFKSKTNWRKNHVFSYFWHQSVFTLKQEKVRKLQKPYSLSWRLFSTYKNHNIFYLIKNADFCMNHLTVELIRIAIIIFAFKSIVTNHD